MTGRHRGGRSLRWRLVVAVMAAAVGQGYAGRHRLAEAALGRATSEQVELQQVDVERDEKVVAARSPESVSASTVKPAANVPVAFVPAVPTPVTTSASVPAPRLAVVPVAAGPDPMADTLPHPVVTLFPLVEPTAPTALAPRTSADDAVYAAVEDERTERTTAELAAGTKADEADEYRGRHTA